MSTENTQKRVPKNNVKFSITLSEEQKLSKASILTHPFNFVLGKAGSGKTLLACQIALDQFFKRQVNKIVITRPTVATEDNGFLPGSEAEKMEPWLVPIRSNMRKVYNKPDLLSKMESDETIELVSLTHFRGRTFDELCLYSR
jgi:predicted ribonuclease YlaK